MTDKEFYLRLGEIWNDLNTFWQKLTVPTHSQSSISDLAEDLLRVKINHFINDWLVVAYIPDSKNVESPRLRNPSSDNEKQIYDYLNETLHILIHWWKNKKDLNQWSITASQLKPLCDELKKMCSKSNRKPIQTIGVVAGLRKIAELLKDAGVGRYTVRKAETLKWDLSAVWADISLDVINVGKGHSLSRKKKFLTHEEDLKALVEDVMDILERIERMPPGKAVKSANKLEYLASELENITVKEPQNKTQVETSLSDLEYDIPNDSQKRVRHSAQKAGIKESATPFEQMQKILNEFIEQLKDLEWSESFAKFRKKIEADKVKIIVNDIKTEQTEAREATDREQIEAEKEIKAQEHLQRKCEYVRGLCELSIKHKKGSPEAIEAAKKVLELLPKIEKGDYGLWREMRGTLFILSEALLAGNEEAKTKTDIVLYDITRKIELLDDFCNQTDKLINYINHPDENRDVSKVKIDMLGDNVNSLAQKIWPQINSDQSSWPFQFPNNWGYISRYGESIFDIPPEHKEQITKRLQQWKDRALKEKSKLQNKMIMRKEKEGLLEPKPPEFLQKLLWICKYGKRHWKLILLAILILLITSIFVLPKFDLFSKILAP